MRQLEKYSTRAAAEARYERKITGANEQTDINDGLYRYEAFQGFDLGLDHRAEPTRHPPKVAFRLPTDPQDQSKVLSE